jgi:hypothetical protein
MYYKNPNPNVVKYSMNARILIFPPVVAFLLHAILPKISFLSDSTYFQQAPNTNMWLISSHLTLVWFVNLSCVRLELLHKTCFLRLGLRVIILECIQYLHCNIITNRDFTLYLGLCHICFFFLCLCNDLCYPLLEWFHLSQTLLFMCLCNYEFCLHFIHILRSFDMLHDYHCLVPLLEVLDSCTYHFSFMVPLLNLLILFQLCLELCYFFEQFSGHVDLSLYLLYLCCFLLLPLLPHLWWSGRHEILPEVLNLMFVLIDCLHNLINLLCHHEFNHLHPLSNFLIGYDQFMLQPIRMVSLIFGLDIVFLEYQFYLISIVLYLL